MSRLKPSPSPAPPDSSVVPQKRSLLTLPRLRIGEMHQFLSWTVLFYLLPFTQFDLNPYPVSPPARPEDIPRWTAWLERWYQVFHPATWLPLDLDQEADEAKIEEVGRLWFEVIKGPEGKDGKEALHLQEFSNKLYKRCLTRFECLYGASLIP